MIVDAATHILPSRTKLAMEQLGTNFGTMSGHVRSFRSLYDLDTRFRSMDEFGNYAQIVSLSSPPIEEIATPSQGGELAQIANDEMAELVAKYPDRFPGFVASVALHDVEEGLVELERAVSKLGAVGLQIFTDVAGVPIDHERFAPAFAAAYRAGIPIWLHPCRAPTIPDFAGESISHFEMWQILGWPYATSVAMMRLILTGLFDRHPGIKIITHHMGGLIPFHYVRLERALLRESMKKSQVEPESRVQHLRRPPLQYLKNFYGDTAMHGAVEPVELGISFFGENRVVFGTDYPFGTIQSGVDMISQLDCSDTVKRKVALENIKRITMGRLKI